MLFLSPSILCLLSMAPWIHLTKADTTVTIINNRDPAIVYSSGWSPIGSGATKDMLTRVAGATATYNFTGIGITVRGTQGTPGGNSTVSTYSIDGVYQANYTVPDTNGIDKNFTFYNSGPNLSNQQHTLLITNLNKNAWYWLDTLLVTWDSSPSTNATSTSTSSVVGASTAALPFAASSSHSATPTGTIVGSALGGAVLFGLLTVGTLVYLWRKRRHNDATLDIGPRDATPYPITEFASRSIGATSSGNHNKLSRFTTPWMPHTRTTTSASTLLSRSPDTITPSSANAKSAVLGPLNSVPVSRPSIQDMNERFALVTVPPHPVDVYTNLNAPNRGPRHSVDGGIRLTEVGNGDDYMTNTLPPEYRQY
ncbi:hypothetical protein K439DRAFT_1614809 [Ramaria rubella]|nr:hypothetical protein K439DRAFT_1614809 [Ramaria rubella]